MYVTNWKRQMLLSLGVAGTVVFAVGFKPADTGVAGKPTVLQRAVYSRLDGIVSAVVVASGAHVKTGDVVARLDPLELDHQIEAARLQIAIAIDERQSALDAVAGGMLTRIPDRRQLSLKVRALELDLQHLAAKRRHLDIRAPVDGVVATPDPAGLVGSRAAPGSPILHIRVEERSPNS